MPNWAELAAFSHYRTATAIRDALRTGDVHEATVGIEELIDAMGRSERRALQSQLERLMKHTIKWQVQPRKRSRSWRRSIVKARKTIREIQEDTPSLTENIVQGLWDRALGAAYDAAQDEVGMDFPLPILTWEEIFEKEYTLND
jgi:hypothetical protein